MAKPKVPSFTPTEEEFLAQYDKERIQRYGKTKSKLPKDLPKTKPIAPYIQPEPYSADMGITKERFPVTQPEFKGYSPEMESALNRYGTTNRPLEELASREAGLTIPEKVPYTQPRPGLVNWESPSIGGVSANSINPSEIQRSFKQFQTSQLPNGKGIIPINPNSFSSGMADTLKSFGTSIKNSPITKAIGNELEYAKPFAKIGGTALGVIGAANLGYDAYQANKDQLQTDQIQASTLGDSLKNYQLDKTQPATNVGELGNPLDNLEYAYRANQVNNNIINPPSIQNGKLVAGTPMEESSPQLQSQVANAFGGVAQMNLDNQQLQNTNDPFSSQALKQLPQQEIVQKLFINPQVEQPKTNILGEPTGKTFGGVSISKDAKGNPVISNTTNPYEGMFTGISKERDAAIDPNTGKVDKNSDFYKRNAIALHNTDGGQIADINLANQQRSLAAQEQADIVSRNNAMKPSVSYTDPTLGSSYNMRNSRFRG